MVLSKKKEDALYNSIHEEIIQARIKIWKMKDNKIISIAEIDDILSKLAYSTPENAINLLKNK